MGGGLNRQDGGCSCRRAPLGRDDDHSTTDRGSSDGRRRKRVVLLLPEGFWGRHDVAGGMSRGREVPGREKSGDRKLG